MAAGNSLPAVHYVLTVEDAEAYERLPAEPGGWTKLLLVVSLAAVGGLYGFLDDQPAPVRIGIAAVAVIVWGAVVWGVRRLRIARNARSIAQRGGSMRVEDRGDGLAIASASGDRVLADAEIGKVLVGDRHVFVLHRGGDPLILPLRAFTDRAAMRAFGEALDRRSAAASP